MISQYNEDLISPDRLVSSRLFLETDTNTAQIIVEGISDYKLLQSLVIDSNCIQIAEDITNDGKGNRNKIIEAIKIANEERIEGIIGIIDSDFDYLVGTPNKNNLYRTDGHDLEAMILKSENAIKKTLINYSKKKLVLSDEDIEEIQKILIDASMPIGYAMWCSNENKWMLKFKDYPIHLFLDENCNLKIQEAYTHLIECSVDSSISLIDMKDEIMNKKSLDNHDLWHVCRGKEMIKVLAQYIKKELKEGSCRNDKVKRDLISSFEKDDFAKTDLYGSIKNWEAETGYLVLTF